MFYRIDARCLHSVLLRFSKYSFFFEATTFFCQSNLDVQCRKQVSSLLFQVR